MTWMFSLATAAGLALAAGGALQAQSSSKSNPFEGDPEAIRAGMAQYRVRCADCHGMDARGMRSPDLTQVWATGRTNEGLARTIREGVPGTEMPAFRPPRTTDDDIWKMLAYLRTLAAPAPTDPPRGNAENGARIFRTLCSSCHRVNGAGGRLGPDLSRAGLARSRDTLERQIRGAMEDFVPGFEPVRLTLTSGQPVEGTKKNEDLFSVQIMDTRERIQGYEKPRLRSFVNLTRSLMPPYTVDQISQADMDDLLRYLQTLGGFDPAVR